MNTKFLPELIRDLESELQRYVHLVREHCIQDFAMPLYRLDLQGKNAGLALLREHCIRFHQFLLVQHGQLYIQEVVPHELAHLVVYKRFGIAVKPHGEQWRWIMQDIFGCKPQVTHNFAVHMHRRKVYWYACMCSDLREFSIVRHKRVQHGTHYICRICKQKLRHVR